MSRPPVAGRRAEREATSEDLSLNIVLSGRYDVSWSLLGRIARGRYGDRRVGEGMVYFYLLLFAAVGAIAVQWMGILLSGAQSVTVVAVAQAVLVGLILAFGFVGRRPGLAVHVGDGRLIARQGEDLLEIDLSDVVSIDSASAVEVHRHWARYAETRLLRYRSTDDAIVLRLSSGAPVVIALPEPDLGRLRAHLEVVASHPQTY